MNSYEIHDNGGRPFMVNVFLPINTSDNQSNDTQPGDIQPLPVMVHIYGPEYSEERLKLAEVSADKVFIGRSPLTNMTKFSGRHGDDFLGNTILLKIGYEYIWIGNRGIIKFSPAHEIVDFISPVGNNDVPYPYAIDSLGNYYLMLDDVILSARPEFNEPYFDPYTYYYDNQRMCTRRHDGTRCLNFDGITGQKINGENYWLLVSPNPGAEYDRLTGVFGTDIQFQYGTEWRPIDRETFIDIMTRASAHLGVSSFQSECICKRGGRRQLTLRMQN